MSGIVDASRIYLDTNAIIYAFEHATDLGNRIRSLLFLEPAERRAIVTSELTLAECIVRPMRENNDDLRDRYEDLLSRNDIIETWPIDWVMLHMAGKLRADHKTLRLPDAIHIATALAAGCDVMLTGDGRLQSEYIFQLSSTFGPRHWHVRPTRIALVNMHANDQAAFNALLEPEFWR